MKKVNPIIKAIIIWLIIWRKEWYISDRQREIWKWSSYGL